MAEDLVSRTAREPRTGTPGPWLRLAFAVSAVAFAGCLYLSVGMGLKACALCIYQRTFLMGVVAVLAIGWLAGGTLASRAGLLALPLAVAGLVVAIRLAYLESAGSVECPGGLFGWGTAPQQSLGAFLVLGVLLAVDVVRRCRTGTERWTVVASGVALGVLLGIVSGIGNPPLPPKPAQPYTTPLQGCRPPYQPS